MVQNENDRVTNGELGSVMSSFGIVGPMTAGDFAESALVACKTAVSSEAPPAMLEMPGPPHRPDIARFAVALPRGARASGMNESTVESPATRIVEVGSFVWGMPNILHVAEDTMRRRFRTVE